MNQFFEEEKKIITKSAKKINNYVTVYDYGEAKQKKIDDAKKEAKNLFQTSIRSGNNKLLKRRKNVTHIIFS